MLEGGEGAGKSTQAALLAAWLADRGVDHLVTREPGGTPVGEAIRSIVLERTDLAMPAESELFLIEAARAAFVSEVVRPALEAGRVVLADRFSLSTLAYQGYGRGIDLDSVRRASTLATGGLEPDLCVVIDVPVEEGARRRARGGRGEDRIEGEGGAFLNNVRDGYLALAALDPGIRVVDGIGPAEEVHARIVAVLTDAFPGELGSPGGGAGSADGR